jgi:integrase
MHEHLILMQSLGYRYYNCERQFLRFDRFLQMRPGAAAQAPDILINEWVNLAPSAEQKVQRLQAARSLTEALNRTCSKVVPTPSIDRRLFREAQRQRRRPYIYSIDEVKRVMVTARRFPSPHAPLRPLTLYTVVVLAYCVGLRFGEIVRLTVGDVDLREETIDVRETKFFKYRRVPLQPSVIAALREYLDTRSCSGAPDHSDAPLFWHERGRCGYSQGPLAVLFVKVLRRAGLKPAAGRVGPRIHDFRHAFVVHRMTAWYREGINPQSRLPHLATYLGHKDIYSTMVYLTMTEELLHKANERFRTIGAEVLLAAQGGKPCN